MAERGDGVEFADPTYAADLGLISASVGRRCAAHALDLAAVAILAIPAAVGLRRLIPDALVSSQGLSAVLVGGAIWPIVLVVVSVVSCSVLCVVQLLVHGRRGVTLGKASFGLRAVSVETLGPPGFWRVTLRAVLLVLASTLLPFLGAVVVFLSCLWDPQRRSRSWIDRISRCWLLDVERGLDPCDARRLRQARQSLNAEPVHIEESLERLATGASRGAFSSVIRSPLGVVGASEHWDDPMRSIGRPQAVAAPIVAHAGPASESEPSRLPALPLFRLCFDDGTRLPVPQTGLVGRDPEAGPDQPNIRVIQLEDPSMQLSKTHAALGHSEGTFWVMDAGSSNGTQVLGADGEFGPLRPRQRTAVSAGSVVRMGGRSFVVEVAIP